MKTVWMLELADAQRAVAAGLEEAIKNGWPVTIAVVDNAGVAVLQTRMDGASPASVTGSLEKAKTSALTGFPTKFLESMVQGRVSLLSMDRVTVEGGVPIIHEGQRVGGIGVSGVQPQQDAQVAEAALAALEGSLSAE